MLNIVVYCIMFIVYCTIIPAAAPARPFTPVGGGPRTLQAPPAPTAPALPKSRCCGSCLLYMFIRCAICERDNRIGVPRLVFCSINLRCVYARQTAESTCEWFTPRCFFLCK